MRPETASQRRRLYLLARVVISRHYREPLTVQRVAGALSCSPRQLQRCYAQFGTVSFREDLQRRRLRVGAQLLAEQRWLTVADVARLVGYADVHHFTRAFRRRYGLTPGVFRRRALEQRRQRLARPPSTVGETVSSCSRSPPPSSASGTGSAPGRRRRINVPPPGAGSAVTLPPC